MGRSVLIVDEEQHIRLLIEQALASIEAQKLELVFLDVMMPKKNGIEVCRAVRGELGMADTHIVLLTAKGQAQDRDTGMAVGSIAPDPAT